MSALMCRYARVEHWCNLRVSNEDIFSCVPYTNNASSLNFRIITPIVIKEYLRIVEIELI